MAKKTKKQAEPAPEGEELVLSGPIADAILKAKDDLENGIPAEVPQEFVVVDLKQDVRINGVLYPAGKNVALPADSFHAYKNAL